MATDNDVRVGRAHPEAELVAATGGSEGAQVKLRVTNVYNSSEFTTAALEATDTIADLKKLLESAFASRPAPHQQRLIFRGKQCEEAQQLGHILRGVDLSEQQMLHLVVTQPAEQSSHQAATPAQPPNPSADTARGSLGGLASAIASHSPQPANTSIYSSSDDVAEAAAVRQPERMELDAEQMAQLQWQYQQALLENQQQNASAAWQSIARSQQQALTSGRPLQQEAQHSWPLCSSEVAVSTATHALGGNMPGPAGGGAVRDITDGPPDGFIPAAGLGENGAEGRGNLADPAPAAPARGAQNWTKVVLQVMVLVVVFGIDAAGWQLTLLAIGGCLTFMFKTGVLENMLGGRREGGGMWKVLCTAANVITEGGGFVMDVRFLFSTFFLSIFPAWKPVRSPEAIAAEEAARAAEAAAVAEETQRRIQEEAVEAPVAEETDVVPAAGRAEGVEQERTQQVAVN